MRRGREARVAGFRPADHTAERHLAAATELRTSARSAASAAAASGRRSARPPAAVEASSLRGLDGDDPLSGCRDANVERHARRDARAKSRGGEVPLLQARADRSRRVELAQSRVEIAANVFEGGLGRRRAQLGDPPYAAGADAPGLRSAMLCRSWGLTPYRYGSTSAPMPLSSVDCTGSDQRIRGSSRSQNGANLQPVWQYRRHVLAAVHREIDLAVEQRILDFLDEKALAADF